MQDCWDLKGCPASHYLKCQAYERNISCWVIKEGCLCQAHESCEDCAIYQKHMTPDETTSTW